MRGPRVAGCHGVMNHPFMAPAATELNLLSYNTKACILALGLLIGSDLRIAKRGKKLRYTGQSNRIGGVFHPSYQIIS
jgi:hypothetical protein